MSRHTIPALRPGHTCVVGYDHGLKTFFAQVTDEEVERRACEAAERVAAAGAAADAADIKLSDADSTVLWVGAARPGEIPTVEELAAQLAPYALLTDEMIALLCEDRRKEESTPRTRLQLEMLDFVGRAGRAQ